MATEPVDMLPEADADVAAQASGLLRRLLAAVDGGSLEAKPALLRRLEGAAEAFDAMAVRDRDVSRTVGPVTAPVQALGYIRVSTDEQVDSGAGLAAQRAALEAEAQRRGWHLEVVADAGYSGKTLDRPGLSSALQRLDKRQAQVLLVSRLDRLSRSVRDFGDLADRARRRGWSVVCLDLGVDTTTPAGELVANVVASTAQYERRLIGQRTREALAVKRQQGVRLGRPPVLPEEVVRRILAAREAGASLRAIAANLTVDGVPTARGGLAWSSSTIQAVLRAHAALERKAS